MKYALLILIVIVFSAKAQQTKPANNSSRNFYSIRDRFYSQFDEKEIEESMSNRPSDMEEPADGILEKFHRWEWLMTPRTFPTGNIPDPGITAKEMKEYRENHPEMNTLRIANWEVMGTSVVPGNGGGAGRVNALRFKPGNPDVMYLGTAGGGVWKSISGGGWQPLTDFLPVISIADVAIDPENTNVVYAATGDGYGYELYWQSDQDFWGGVYSAGVFKSSNGGATWLATGLSFEQDKNEIIQRLVINPVNQNILLAATRSGIYYTDDGGLNWTITDSVDHCYDFAFKPDDPNTVYAAADFNVLVSNDAGATWSVLASSVAGGGRMSIETSAANPDVIYILSESYVFKRSDDGGLTWTAKQYPTAGFYGYYDTDFDVSSADEDYLIAGGLTTSISTDGGDSWQGVSVWTPYTATDYVHADGHCVRFHPGSTTTIYSANDGGIFKSDDLGQHWTDMSNGLMIAQAYRMSSSATNPNIMYSGWQDNGTNKWDGTNWTQVYYADGMETRVDYTNENIVYVEYQYGGLQKSIDGGLNFQYIAPSSGDWITPYTIDPVDHNILYYGGYDVYKTTNGGSSWAPTNAGLGDNCFWISVALSDNNYVYACALNTIKFSTNAGSSWSNITGSLPVGSAGMNYIAVSDYDPQRLWVAFSGYSDSNKVFYSEDGGSNWTNVSGTLPNVPVNTIVYENGSSDGVYIGTDVGVFYRDSTMSDWMPYMNGLPNVMVHELEINYTAKKLRAATYGRGMWQSDLYYYVPPVNDIGVTNVSSPPSDICSDEIIPEVTVTNSGNTTITSFDVSYSVDGGLPDVSNWNDTLVPTESVLLTLPSTNITNSGVHSLTVTTSNPNGVTDDVPLNDADSINFNYVISGLPLQFQEGFESAVMPPANWALENDNSLWSITNNASGFGNSVYSALANFHDVDSGVDVLTTPFLDFSQMLPPLQITFDWAHANGSPDRQDSLRVQISVDCGATWTDLFYKGGDSLASVPFQNAPYVPAEDEWKQEFIPLDTYNPFTTVLIRFEAISSHGNNLYLDDINITGTPVAIDNFPSDNNIIIYPNPTDDVLHVFIPPSQKATAVSVCNLLGEELNLFNAVNKTSFTLDLSKQQNGMYFLKVISEEGMQMLPFVLQR